MEGKDEKNERATPLLQIDPKCIQDALRAFFQPTKSDDDRLNFYAIYQKEATRYDAERARTRNEDLNIILILAGLFSAVSSAFIVDINPKLEPKPDKGPVDPPGNILIALNQTDVFGDDPPTGIHIAAGFMYYSLVAALVAALMAMFLKQRLNKYLLPVRGPMIERCGVRQHRHDAHPKTTSVFLDKGLPALIWSSPVTLILGLCIRMWFTNFTVALYITAFAVAGLAVMPALAFHLRNGKRRPPRTPVTIAPRTPYKEPWSTRLLENVQSKISHLVHRQSQTLPMSTTQGIPPNPAVITPWLTPTAMATLRGTNADDVHCVSWTLRDIADPVAVDAALRLAGIVRWFEDGINVVWRLEDGNKRDVEPPYDVIVSTLEGCFDSAGKVYPRLMDRAYHSARATLWIHICATCLSHTGVPEYPLPIAPYDTTCIGDDLRHILGIYSAQNSPEILAQLYRIDPGFTPMHMQWTSTALLRLSWAERWAPGAFDLIVKHYAAGDWSTIPLNAALNRMLTWCIFLDWPVDESVLRVQDKSHHSERIVSELSQAIASAIRTPHSRSSLLPHMLADLSGWGQRPSYLTKMAYELCSVIFENYSNLADGNRLLFLSLQIGFRHLDPQHPQIPIGLTHTEHHRRMINRVFEDGDEEVKADLLHAWTSHSDSHRPPPSLDTCARHLVGLRPSSRRLRRLVIRAVGSIGYQGFERVGLQGLCDLLDHLCANDEDLDDKGVWARLLLDTIQSSEGMRRLSHSHWEMLVELLILEPRLLQGVVWSPCVTASLESDREWDRLECWMAVVWMAWPPGTGSTAGEDVRRAMLSLFRQRPGAIPKLEQWIGRWSVKHGKAAPDDFRQICEQTRPKETRQVTSSNLPTDEKAGESARSPPPPISPSPGKSAG